MAYYQNFQPYPYQDQLSQLRGLKPYQRQDASCLNWVQGEAGAKSWMIAPGATVLLMDSESMRFYIKSADMNGVPTMRTFEYNEVGVQPSQAANFVTVDEFNEFKNDVLSRLEAPRKKKGANADEQSTV